MHQNQLVYLLASWKEFLKVKDSYDIWRKKKATCSPQRRIDADESFDLRFADVPKLEYKFTLDKYESQTEMEADPNEW